VALSRDLAAAYDRLGTAVASSGDTRGGLELFRRTRQLLELVASDAPADLDLRRMLAVSYQRIGNTLGNPNYPSLGDPGAGAVSVRAAIARLEALSAREPADTPTRRSLAVAYSSLSDILVAQGDRPGAQRAQATSLALFERLGAEDSTDAQAQRDLALASLKRAELARDDGRLDEAEEPAARAVAVFERLAAADPGNSILQGDVTAAYSSIGDLYLRRGKPDDALRVFDRMVAMQERLARADGGNPELRFALATAYSQKGEALSAAALRPGARATSIARLRDARRWFIRSLDIFEDLERKGVLTGEDARQPGRITELIARCDAELARRGIRRRPVVAFR
jgi:pentatricopeptide repeat protein